MLISSCSAIRQGAELIKCGGAGLTTAAVCVEGNIEREVGCGGRNVLSVHERDISMNKTRQIHYSNGTQRK